MEKQEATNKGLVLLSPGKLQVKDVGYPKFESPTDGSSFEHGAILKVISTCICGSDRHTLHGRAKADPDMLIGHEITGEVVEVGRGVHCIKPGDIVSVPFNVSCGCCDRCVEGRTSLCQPVNPLGIGGVYGYPMQGGWAGGQSQYHMVPYADFNLLKFPDHYKSKVMDKILDLALLTDVLPTALHGVKSAKVDIGSTVYIAGAGPIGLTAATLCRLMGASVIFLADPHSERLDRAKKMLQGCITINSKETSEDGIKKVIENAVGNPNVDSFIDCVGYEQKKLGSSTEQNPAGLFNLAASLVRPGGFVSFPGVYLAPDPKGVDKDAKQGIYALNFAQFWTKGISLSEPGQCPVKRYQRKLMMAVLHDQLSVAELLNIRVVSLEEAPKAFEEFDKGKSMKIIIDPNGMIRDVSKKRKAEK